MKNYTNALIIFLMTTSGIFAQINFEKGHFVTENNIKTDCFIKNEGWENNPSKFEYKLTLDGDTKVLRMTNLKSVVIDNAYKFEKHTVQFDDTDRSIKKLSYERSPRFTEKTFLLNVLIEGKVTLYSYIDGNKKAFYYKKEGKPITTLIYKVYSNENRAILYNKRYQQQLLTELACGTISEKKVSRVDYQTGDLTAFFRDYNECKGATTTEFNKKKKGTFHLKVTAGFYNSSSKTDLGLATFFRSGLDTDAAWAPTFGAELEYVFPFNKNKWAMFIAPNYSSYKGEGKFLDLLVERRFELEYSAIQIPVGFRHYFFLNDKSKIFLSGAIVVDLPLNQKTAGNFIIPEEDFKTSAGAAFGFGYSYDKYSIEARYIPSRELVEKASQSSVKLNQFSITLGYTLF